MLGIFLFEGQVRVTAIRFFPTSLSDGWKFEQNPRDYWERDIPELR